MAAEEVIDDGDLPSTPAPVAAVEAAAAVMPAPIIVKKITIQEAGHHGGAWKVAYADFVTAMMAFFLLLWLLGATTEDQRKGLADHFTPTLVKLKEQSAGSDGMLGGSSITDVDIYPNRQGQTGNQTITIPRDARGGPERDGAARSSDLEAARKSLQQRISERMREKAHLRKLVKQIRVVQTIKGVRIDLVDDADFSMFALGTTVLAPQARELLGVAASALDEGGAKLIVRGHTDSVKWRPGMRANNWSLSAGRAEATRQELIRQGVGENRFLRIEGVADREIMIEDDPHDPRNRRMSVILAD